MKAWAHVGSAEVLMLSIRHIMMLAFVPALGCDLDARVDTSSEGPTEVDAALRAPERPLQSREDATQTAIGDYPGFSWVEDGFLAGMPRPGAVRPLADDLATIADRGVDILVSLTEFAPSPEALQAAGLEGRHYPVKDFSAPTIAQLTAFVADVRAARLNGLSVGVHCEGGHGRTGTFLAAWFIAGGMKADDAIAKIRQLRPGSIETLSQERVLRSYAMSLRLR